MVLTWIRRVVTLLLLLLIAAALAAWWYGHQALPRTSGTLSMPGLNAEVRIARDANGIPSISAGSVADVMFGLGVVHVQDRLWQMETHRRIGAGRLSEVFGEGALGTDQFIRTLGVRQVAAAQWAQASAESREVVLAYTAGVNAAINQLKALPPEYHLLQFKPEPWTPEDSLAWTTMMALDLGANWQTEALRLRLALKLPKARIDELLPPYPGDKVPDSLDYVAFYSSLKLDANQTAALDQQIKRSLALAPEAELEGVGSNSWVLAGSRTSTGQPLLANDPHLRLSTPALWYFVRLKAPGLDVAGATMPGLPGVVVGQNQTVAWGFTNTGPDVQDSYLERLNPDNPQQYQTPEGWAAFGSRQEVIKVKGKPDLVISVRSTRHGPVISDVAGSTGVDGEALGPKARPSYVLSLRWTGLDTDNDPLASTLAMMRAGSVEQFVQAASTWVAPMQNMAVADRDGRIALISPGRVPKRKPDNDLHGLAPAPGWDARYDWDGFLPVEALPQLRDPERGFIANANQKITPPDYPHLISHNWGLPFRHQRIEQLIEAKPKHGLDDLRQIQADQKSLAAVALLPRLKALASSHPLAAAAMQQLSGFDGTMHADRAAPLIYWAWHRQLSHRLMFNKVGAGIYDGLLGKRGYFDALDSMLARNDPWWCDDKTTAAVETCEQQVVAAFDAALDELKLLQGDNPAKWRWGQAHQARSEHRPFSRVPLLARWFEQRLPVGGDTYTVNVGRVSLKPDPVTGEFYLDEHGPSLRALYDLADRNNSRVMHSTGQSGIPWSPLYRSFSLPWQQVKDVPLFVPDSALSEPLVLKPAGR